MVGLEDRQAGGVHMSVANDRNVATIRRLAKEMLAQCDHYARNTRKGHEDAYRFYIFRDHATRILRASEQGVKRLENKR